MTRVYGSLLALVALVLFCSPPPAAAQLDRAGVVTTLQGTATVVRANTRESLPLKFRDEVYLRDRITTGDDSVARILLGGKAIVTVRERSVLTITEVPGAATVDVAIGKVALAVVKERMKPGETIDIRTPNAVAGIRGTVVITEVEQATAQVGPVTGGAFTSTFTVLTGVVQVSQVDPQTRRPIGAGITLNQLERTGITGFRGGFRPPQRLNREAVQHLSNAYKLKVSEGQGTTATNASLATSQVGQASIQVNKLPGLTSHVGLELPGVRPEVGGRPETKRVAEEGRGKAAQGESGGGGGSPAIVSGGGGGSNSIQQKAITAIAKKKNLRRK